MSRTADAVALVSSLVPAGARILDAGCGTGELVVALSQAGFVALGLDKDLDAIRPVSEEHPRIPFYLDDLTDLELPMALVGRGFDAVVLEDVVGGMGLADLAAALAATARLVAPAGVLVATVPEGSVGTATRTATRAGWAEDRRLPWAAGDLAVVFRRADAAAPTSRVRSFFRR